MPTINGVKVSIPEIRSTKTSISNDGKEIMAQLQRVKGSMEYLKGTEVWSSEGAREIQSKFEVLYPRFQSMKTVIDDYANKLENTINKYDATESAIVQDISSVNDWA